MAHRKKMKELIEHCNLNPEEYSKLSSVQKKVPPCLPCNDPQAYQRVDSEQPIPAGPFMCPIAVFVDVSSGAAADT
jgi:hypothetical protein